MPFKTQENREKHANTRKKSRSKGLIRSNCPAFYDKKLLWRANLYVDNQASDWNNAHPWTYGNEWIDADYNQFDPKIEGGQISILPSTWHCNSIKDGNDGEDTNIEVTNTTIYSWYATTYSPMWYNKNLLIQQGALGHYFNSYGTEFVTPRFEWPDPDAENASDFSSQSEFEQNVFVLNESQHWPDSIRANDIAPYERTTAPDGVWENYTDLVFRPAWSSYGGWEWDRRLNTIGIDCGGLIYAAAGYDGEDFPELDRYWIDAELSEVSGSQNGQLIYISGKDEIIYPTDGSDPYYNNLDTIVIGDILYLYRNVYSNDNNCATYTGYHVAIVNSVNDENGDGIIQTSEIKLLESTYRSPGVDFGDGFGQVYTQFDLENYENRNFWILGRLRSE